MNQATASAGLDLEAFFASARKAEEGAARAIMELLQPLSDEHLQLVGERVAEHTPRNHWLANLVFEECYRRSSEGGSSHAHAGAPYAHLRKDRPTTQQEGN